MNNHHTSNDDNDPDRKTKGILASLMLIEDQSKHDRDEEDDDRTLLSAKTSRPFDDYYSSTIDTYQNYVVETERIRKKSRSVSNAALLAVSLSGNGEVASSSSPPAAKEKQANPQQTRRLWVKDRDSSWWDQCNCPDYPQEDFRKAFRMSQPTFNLICDELKLVVAKEDTTLRTAVPVRQRVAVCVWRLATGEPLRLVSKRFGLGISTCHKLVLEVCSAIKNVLMPKYLQWPDEDGVRMIKNEFESVSGIANVVGSMYTTHIPIIAPKISVAAYFNKRHTERNQKTSYSITLQGVVDHRGVFTDVCIGWPGSMPDDQVLEKSALFQRANGGLLKDVWIAGGAGYPLMEWVLVPYSQQHLTWTQHAFNEKMLEIQGVAKRAFARLKGRWSCLHKRTEVKLQDLPVVLGACCVLHNICELRGEEVDSSVRVEIVDDEMVPEVAIRSAVAIKTRDAIAHNILHHSHPSTRFM